MSDLAASHPAPQERPPRRLLDTLISRAVRERFASDWFQRKLESVLHSDAVADLFKGYVIAMVNAVVTSHIHRPGFRAELRELVREAVAETVLGAHPPEPEQEPRAH